MASRAASWSPAYGAAWVPSGARYGVNPLSMVSTGLLYEDGFDGDLSAYDESGTWAIVGGQARGTGWGALRLKPSVVAARNKSYVQIKMTRVGNTAAPAIQLRWNSDVDAYYTVLLETNFEMWRVSDTSYFRLDTNPGWGGPDGVSSITHMYIADGDQRNWKNQNALAVETDTVLNGQVGIPDFWAREAGQNSDFDDFIYMTDKILVATGLQSGEKFKVINAAEGVVGSATESGGTATLDLGGVQMPMGGWPNVIITDGSDVELQRLTGAHYPGGVYVQSL